MRIIRIRNLTAKPGDKSFDAENQWVTALLYAICNLRIPEGRIEAFCKNRSKVERLLRAKYLSWPVEEPETVLLKTMDVEKLRKTTSAS